MTSKEALEKLRQETCPATYMNDFDKEECLKTIKEDLELLEILKDKFYIKFETHDWGSYINIVGKKDYDENDGIDCIAGSDFLDDEKIEFLKEYFKENKDGF